MTPLKTLTFFILLLSVSCQPPPRAPGVNGDAMEGSSSLRSPATQGSHTPNPCTSSWQADLFPRLNAQLERSEILNESRPAIGSKIGDVVLEIRVWVGFGISTLRGFVLRQKGSSYDGIYIQAKPQGSERLAATRLDRTNEDWSILVSKLLQQGIATIQDECDVSTSAEAPDDADLIIVETFVEGESRAILYSSHGRASDKVLEICDSISTDLDIVLCQPRQKLREVTPSN